MKNEHSRKPCKTQSFWLKAACLTLSTLVAQVFFAPEADAWPKRKKKQGVTIVNTPYSPSGEWEAYFRDAEGDEYALHDPIEKHKDSEWMYLQFTDFKGNRSRLAVWQVEDRIGARAQETTHSFRGWNMTTRSSSAPLAAIEELITSSMFNTNRFDLVERKQIDALLAEQDFGDSGRVTDESAARIGQALGADYILFVAVNEWTPRKSSKGTVGYGKTIAEVALSFKVVDTETGRVSFAETVRGRANSKRLNVPFFGSQNTSPVNYAMSSAINKASYLLATSLKNKPWRGSVVYVDGDIVTINGGENRGLSPGMKFLAVSRGREMRDPESGQLLGYQEDVIGSIKVTTVQDLMATAVVVEGCNGLKAGDFVRHDDTGDS